MDKNIISAEEASDLLSKLLNEQIPLKALLRTPNGIEVNLRGFVSSITVELGLVISAARPVESGPGFFSVPIFNRACDFRYGDKRELPESLREELSSKHGDAALTFGFSDGDFLALFFTL